MDLDKTLDPALQSWLTSANDADSEFPIQNLPYGVFISAENDEPHIGVAIGSQVLDLHRVFTQSVLHSESAELLDACSASTLNKLMVLELEQLSLFRENLSALLSVDTSNGTRDKLRICLLERSHCKMLLPSVVGDYTDFYASIHHATNVGRLFRPDNPLLPNYKFLPIGYHGRSSSIVPSGTTIRRPKGQIKMAVSDLPVFSPSRQLDYELELGWFIRGENEIGISNTLDEAAERIFGFCLLNDWSARDIQAWEYQPLGPFLAKNFATTISPWVVATQALEPFRVPALQRIAADPPPLPHLQSSTDQVQGGLSIRMKVQLQSEQMRQQGLAPALLSDGNFSEMYWTVAQMTAHHASNGCNLRPGDLLGSGTVSGRSMGSLGCLLEITKGGTLPIALPSGEQRTFLEEGDEITMTARCEREGFRSIGFGECRGRILSSHPSSP